MSAVVAEKVRGRLLADASMTRYSSWRAGGKAEQLFIPADKEDLCDFLAELDAGVPVHFIGLGSNLLVRDGGVAGVVIRLAPGLTELTQVGETQVYAEAGVAAPKFARFASDCGLTGAEFMVGIPGSIGGALAMNAGCFGGQTWEIVTSVTVVSARGDCVELDAEEFSYGYRQLHHPEYAPVYFIGACFALEVAAQSPAQVDDYLAKRAATQPIGSANAGSVFTNPVDDAAGRLIEAAGLAGKRVGDACVSTKHCNFIINEGQASATDIETLIEQIQVAVKEHSGVDLIPEVRIIGERA